MSHLIGILLTLVSLVVTASKALPDIHKQMSTQELQSIFHVATADAVPHYEVVQLLHQDNQEPATAQHHNHYSRRKRSIEAHQQLADLKQKGGTQHVKKDLSKNSYHSEIKKQNSAKSFNSNSLRQEADSKGIKDIKEHKVSFNAFGKDMNLTLKRTQGLFESGQVHNLPMWYVDNEANATHGLKLQKIEDELNHTSDNVGQVFQDEENMAAILMRRHEVTGDLVMEGSIGNDMVIKPLPHNLMPHQKESHHVIFKRAVDTSEHLSDFAFMEPDDMATSEMLEKLQNRQKRAAGHRVTLEELELEEEQIEADEDFENTDESSAHKRAKRQAPFIIYPEILVIVDYDGYRLHGGDNLQVKRYFISFWNGVDLRYRLLKGPKIRISIAGIIISRGRDATPYLERNRVGRDAIDSAAALTDMGKYLFRERRLPVYDIAVAITKYDMCRRRKGGRCTKGTAGFAYVGGACVVNKRLEKVNSVAIIEDTGGFSGIIVAAHEVGHLLGAVHDGSPPPSYLGGPGAQRCRWEDGYIMSDLRHTERGFRWSPCTVQSFHHFLNGDTATCLHNAPHEDSALGRSLPGTLLSLDAQCRRDRGTYACFKDERVCAQLFCFDAQTGYCVAYRPAAEGSSCGNNFHCLDGRCTPLPSNVITHFGQQYRSGYNNSVQSAAASTATHEDNGNPEDELDENGEDDGDNQGNGGEDNDESNETVEKLKRKLSIPLTTKSLQLQHQPQQQLHTTVLPLTTMYLATAIPRYGSKSTTSSSPSRSSSFATSPYLENYFKKPPAITATAEIFKTNENQSKLKKLNENVDVEKQQPTQPDKAKADKSIGTFEAQFLKRTPPTAADSNDNDNHNDNDNDNDNYSSSSLNTNNPYFITKSIITNDAIKTSASRSNKYNSNNNGYNNNNNSNKNNRQKNNEPVQTFLVTPNSSTRPPPPHTPAYVTNYIGDNTQQRLTTIRHQQQLQQQLQQDTTATTTLQQFNSPQHALTTLPPPNNQQQQFESFHLFPGTTRRPKIKTHKLIRRLRTQIK